MTAPLQQTLEEDVAAVSTAGNSLNHNVAVSRWNGTVSSVTYVPDAAITGANTNTRSVSLVNKGQSGSGTAVIATLQFNSGVNAAANDETALTLSGTPANLVVVAGDVLQWQSTAVGTGITDPGGMCRVVLSRGNVSS